MSNPDKNKHYATDDPEIETITRMSLVGRWHMLGQLPRQSLGDHSANVAMLAFLIARRAPAMFFGDPDRAMVAGMIHDAGEAFAGDSPPLVKEWLEPGQIAVIEAALLPPIFAVPIPTNTQLLVKICDYADAIRWLRRGPHDNIVLHAEKDVTQRYWSRIETAATLWPPVVTALVLDITHRYAFETRIYTSCRSESPDLARVLDHLARGSGNQPGGPGSELRGPYGQLRDWMDGTEGGEDPDLKAGGTD